MSLVNGEGPIPCDYLILGEAPGAEEERLGRPFVGASGKLLDRALEAAGVSRNNVYITNAYKLRPPGNRTPTAKELDEHHQMLADEIRQVSPRIVLLLGATALRAALDKTAVTWHHGKWIDAGRRSYFVAIHPSYAIRTRTEDAWIATVGRFFNEFSEHTETR